MTARHAVLLLALAAAGATAGQERSSRDLERLPPHRADAIARHDLLSIIRSVAPPNRGMYRRLRQVGFTTRAYATAYPGLCGRDELLLHYAAPADRQNDRDAPLTPYSLTSSAAFHLNGTALRKGPSNEPGDPAGADACTAVERADGWFGAPDAGTAMEGLAALALAQRAVAQHLVPLGCDGASCSPAALARLAPVAVVSIERCDATHGRDCFLLRTSANEDELTVILADPRDDRLAARDDPSCIVSVHWTIDQIIVT